MLIYDTQKLASAKPMPAAREPVNVGAAAGRGRGGWSAYKLPDYLDFPGLTTRDYLVTFDKARPSVQLPTEVDDLYESVHSYVFNKYYVALTANHEASYVKGGEAVSARLPTSWMDQVKPRTRAITTSQVTKDGLTAILKTRQWADQIRKARPGLLDKEAVEKSLARTWRLWISGMKEATGHAYIPVQEIASKIHRR